MMLDTHFRTELPGGVTGALGAEDHCTKNYFEWDGNQISISFLFSHCFDTVQADDAQHKLPGRVLRVAGALEAEIAALKLL